MDEKQHLTAHLSELRNRIIITLVVILVNFGLLFYFSEYIFKILTLPLHSTLTLSSGFPFLRIQESAHPGQELVFLGPAEALWMHIKISLISALILSSPVIFYQIWKFVSPGLLDKEKKYALPFVGIASSLFLFGALFCFLIVLPFAINFLLTYKTETIKPMLSVGKYIDFCLKFILAFGTVFELPVVLVFLTRTGVVSTEFLAKNRKYAILLAFVAAAILTPTPDAFNQSLMALPIILLYETGIWSSRLLKVKGKDKEKGK